jgi:hypothetical protein
MFTLTIEADTRQEAVMAAAEAWYRSLRHEVTGPRTLVVRGNNPVALFRYVRALRELAA